jgi:hypothetical protein
MPTSPGSQKASVGRPWCGKTSLAGSSAFEKTHTRHVGVVITEDAKLPYGTSTLLAHQPLDVLDEQVAIGATQPLFGYRTSVGELNVCS